MKDALRELLNSLDDIGADNEEIYDSDVRQLMSNAIMESFVRHRESYVIPDKFGMFSDTANAAVKKALTRFVDRANREAPSLSLNTFHARLEALQDNSVRNSNGKDYDEFLGHSESKFFDEFGNVIRMQ